MNFGEAIKSVFSKYATFSGRARRSEYWNFVFFNLIAIFVLYFIDKTVFPERHILSKIYSLFVLIPGLAVIVRRLHDIGKSGLVFLLVYLISYIFALLSIVIFVREIDFGLGEDFDTGLTLFLIIDFIALFILSIILLVWMCRDSMPRENEWGPNPKGQNEVPSVTQITASAKDDTDKLNENKIIIDDVEYELENHVTFSGYNGTGHMDGAEPVVDGTEPSYSFHADIEKRTFNTTINLPEGEWIFCHFHFQSNDLEFGPENFISGKITIDKDDSGLSFKGEGKLDTGQTVSFYINTPTEKSSL